MRKQQKITTRSFVHYHGELVELKTLPPEVREEIATKLAITYFNTLFAGRATFYPADEARPE